MRVSVVQQERELLDRLQRIFGDAGSIYYQKPRSSNKGCHALQIQGREAFRVACLLWPRLSEKKKAQFKRCVKRIRETRADDLRSVHGSARLSRVRQLRLDGLTYDEIAAETKIPRGTIGRWLGGGVSA